MQQIEVVKFSFMSFDEKKIRNQNSEFNIISDIEYTTNASESGKNKIYLK